MFIYGKPRFSTYHDGESEMPPLHRLMSHQQPTDAVVHATHSEHDGEDQNLRTSTGRKRASHRGGKIIRGSMNICQAKHKLWKASAAVKVPFKSKRKSLSYDQSNSKKMKGNDIFQRRCSYFTTVTTLEVSHRYLHIFLLSDTSTTTRAFFRASDQSPA